MAVNYNDQAARYIAKRDPPGFLRCVFPKCDPALVFFGWLDTRTVPYPGEPDRICDTVAGLGHTTDPDKFWAAVVEFQAAPDEEGLERLLEYKVRLRRELKHPPLGVDTTSSGRC
jgi:hypothetical protein